MGTGDGSQEIRGTSLVEFRDVYTFFKKTKQKKPFDIFIFIGPTSHDQFQFNFV